MTADLIYKFFGDNLKRILREKNISQKQLSQKIGLHPMQISRWMMAKSQPSFDSIAAICEVINIEPDQLFRNPEKTEEFNKEEMALFQKFQQFQKTFTNAS